MKKMIQSITGGYASSAKVVDGTLILSLPDAISPVVWRMDLAQVESSALEVREAMDGTHMLTLKTSRKDVQDVAPFTTRGAAVRALMAASRALEQGQGRTRPIPAAHNAAPPAAPVAYAAHKGGIGKWLAVAAVLVVIVVLLNIRAGIRPPTGSFPGIEPASSGMGNASAPGTAGVPVSADDFLRAR